MLLTQIKFGLTLALAAGQVVFATPTSSGRPTKFVKNNVATAFFAVHLGGICAWLPTLFGYQNQFSLCSLSSSPEASPIWLQPNANSNDSISLNTFEDAPDFKGVAYLSFPSSGQP